jgi:hypothetical protein
MQKVAEIIPPLRPKEGFAARGSASIMGSCPVKLMRRKISRFDVAPDAASLGDWAITPRRLAGEK